MIKDDGAWRDTMGQGGARIGIARHDAPSEWSDILVILKHVLDPDPINDLCANMVLGRI